LDSKNPRKEKNSIQACQEAKQKLSGFTVSSDLLRQKPGIEHPLIAYSNRGSILFDIPSPQN
jgi:hypothetical protein